MPEPFSTLFGLAYSAPPDQIASFPNNFSYYPVPCIIFSTGFSTGDVVWMDVAAPFEAALLCRRESGSEIVSYLKQKEVIIPKTIKEVALGNFKKGSGLQTQFQV